jgi:hypothetical protein
MSASGYEVPRFDESDRRIFQVPDPRQRNQALITRVLPKLEILTRQALDLAREIYGPDVVARSSFRQTPNPRPTAENQQGSNYAIHGIWSGRKPTAKGIVTIEGKNSEYLYTSIENELTRDYLTTRLNAFRTSESRLLVQIMKKHLDKVEQLIESCNGMLCSPLAYSEVMSERQKIEITNVPSNAKHKWWTVEIWGYVNQYHEDPINFDRLSLGFVALFPIYQTMLDYFFDRSDHFDKYYDSFQNYYDGLDRDVDDQAKNGEPASNAVTMSHPDRPMPVQEVAHGFERDQADKELGLAGEVWVVESEMRRLEQLGRSDLAARVVHASVVEGDGLGYDVRSFNPTGEILFIEVKTTRGPRQTPFEITANELKFAEIYHGQYALYRVYDFDKKPQCVMLPGSPRDHVRLEPTRYRASL